MNPVIQRELLEQCRNPALFRLRLISGAGAIGALLWGITVWAEMKRSGNFVFGPWGALFSEGGFVFGRVQMVLTLLILALAPTLTADAIARERRESTLNLLGLTPLTPFAVAVGKSAANLLRALTLWLAAVPILTVPFLMGGVGGRQVVEVMVVHGVILLVGLAAGLLASAVSTQFRRALALAFVLELVLLVGVDLVHMVAVIGLQVVLSISVPTSRPMELSQTIHLVSRVVTGEVMRPLPPGFPMVSAGQWLASLGGLIGAVVLVGWLTVLTAARRIARLWKEEPVRPRTLAIQRELTRPVLFPGWIRQQQRRRLAQNPLVWIQHRSVAASLTRWGWIFIVILVWMLIATTGGWMGGIVGQWSVPVWMAPLLLMGGMAFSAAGGFRAERENGTLELLLVTPLTLNQLLQSRWSSHVREFLFPVMLQLSLSIYVEGLWRRAGVDYSRFNWWLLTSLLVLPAVGLWRGLRARNFVTAVLSTGFWGLFLPGALAMVVSAFGNPDYFGGPAVLQGTGVQFFLETRLDWGVLPAVMQFLIGLVALVLVRRELVSRQFAHQTSGGG